MNLKSERNKISCRVLGVEFGKSPKKNKNTTSGLRDHQTPRNPSNRKVGSGGPEKGGSCQTKNRRKGTPEEGGVESRNDKE